MPDIYQQAEEFRQAVAQHDALAAGKLSAAYETILESLEKELNLLLARIEHARREGRPVTESWLRQDVRYRRLIEKAKNELGYFARASRNFIERRQEGELERGVRDAEGLIRLADVGASFEALPKGAIENLVGMLEEDSPLGQLLGRDFARAGAGHIRTVLLRGVGSGWGVEKMAAEMRKALVLPRARALMIARTEALRAYRLASLQTYQEHPGIVLQYRWLAAKSTRTCLNCLSRDGSLWPTSQIMPVHVNCRCTLVFVTWRTPPPRITGKDWFEAQSEKTQREMMGNAAHELYKAGRITLRDFEGRKESAEWGTMTYQRSLREIKKQALILS